MKNIQNKDNIVNKTYIKIRSLSKKLDEKLRSKAWYQKFDEKG